MDLFAVVRLKAPQRVAVGVGPLRDGEVPILQATAGRVMELAIPELEGSHTPVAAPPVQQVPPVAQPDAEVARTLPTPDFVDLDELSEEEEEPEHSQLVRKRTSDDEGSSKKLRFDVEASTSSAQLK